MLILLLLIMMPIFTKVLGVAVVGVHHGSSAGSSTECFVLFLLYISHDDLFCLLLMI